MPDINEKGGLKIYLRILSYLRPYSRQIVMILIFNFMFVIFNTLSIWMVAPFITTLFESQSTEQQIEEVDEEAQIWDLNRWLKQKLDGFFRRADRIDTLKLLCLLIFAAFFFKNLFMFLETWWVSFVEQRVIKNLRDAVYDIILWQSLSFFSTYRIGGLISRITNDINSLNVALNRSFTKIIRDPIMILIFLALLISISWQLTLLSLIVFPITGILLTRIGQSLKRRSRRVQERLADLTSILQETISGVKIVKAFAMENYENEKFQNKTQQHFKAVLRQVRLNRLSSPLSETVGVGIMVTVLWFGGQLVLSGQLLDSENFIRFIAVLFAIMEPIKSLGNFNNNVQIALASGKRVFKILDTPITIIDRPGAIEKNQFTHEIRYTNVSFKYTESGDTVLKDVSIHVPKNQKIAIVGGSGAGKTTMVNLLPRFYDVSEGSISIDGTDIRDIKLKSLRQMMGIVTQDVILFNDSVANNIAYGLHDYSRHEIENAADLANASHFINDLPDSFDTIIGEQGMRLSGGQRQRISIARAILKNPPILIFDEATSSLDSESERLIQEAIDNLMRDRTVLIIAHRLSSIIKSDKILVLENGEVIDEGSHTELLARSKRYKYLYELQFAV
jgi:subfamily B ATP-binding cassette protein MsbA